MSDLTGSEVVRALDLGSLRWLRVSATVLIARFAWGRER